MESEEFDVGKEGLLECYKRLNNETRGLLLRLAISLIGPAGCGGGGGGIPIELPDGEKSQVIPFEKRESA